MANKELWTEYNGKGFGAEYADYAVRATKDEDGNVIADTYATKAPMTGATAQANGKAGLVPAPLIADKDKYLKGDGTWDVAGSDKLPSGEPAARFWYAPMRQNSGSGATSEWKLGVYGTGAGTFNSFTITAESQGNGVLVKESVFNNASNGQVLYKNNNVGFAFKTVNEVPSSTASDSGKVLKVNQSGSAEWAILGA